MNPTGCGPWRTRRRLGPAPPNRVRNPNIRLGHGALLAAFLIGACACTRDGDVAAAEAAAGEPAVVVIADGRVRPDSGDLSAWTVHPALQQARVAAQAYWRARNPVYEDDYRVLAVAQAAFTRRGADQQAVLYLLSRWPRCCPNLGLALIEDQRLLGSFAFDAVAQTLAAVPDLDGDGLEELVMSGEFGMGGHSERSFTLLSLASGAPRSLGGSLLGSSDCAAMGAKGRRAVRVTATPGLAPVFRAGHYVAGCETQDWLPDGGTRMLKLEPARGPAFVALDRR